MTVCLHLYYIEACGLLLGFQFTQLSHKGVVMVVTFPIIPTTLLVYGSAIYAQGMRFKYCLEAGYVSICGLLLRRHPIRLVLPSTVT